MPTLYTITLYTVVLHTIPADQNFTIRTLFLPQIRSDLLL